MGYLVRKFTRSKWGNPVPADYSNLNADAVTSCLRTTRNTLSVWRIENEKELDQAILAIAGTLERLQTFDIVSLDETEILAL